MNTLSAGVLSVGLSVSIAAGTYEMARAVSLPTEKSIVEKCAHQLGSVAVDSSSWVANCGSYAPGSLVAVSEIINGHKVIAYTLPGEVEFLESALPVAEKDDEDHAHMAVTLSALEGILSVGVISRVIRAHNKQGGGRQDQAAYQQALQEVWRM